jgi:hypothetical protein
VEGAWSGRESGLRECRGFVEELGDRVAAFFADAASAGPA